MPDAPDRVGRSWWLGIDTATAKAGIALCDGVEVVGENMWTSARHQSRELGPLVDRMLSEAGLRPPQLDGVAVTIGPGSYTGLRIGLALAKGLVLGGVPRLVGVPTLDVLAAALMQSHGAHGAHGAPGAAPDAGAHGAHSADGPLWAVVRAGRGRVVGMRFDDAPPPFGSPREAPVGSAMLAETVSELAERIKLGERVAGELDQSARAVLGAAGARVLPPAACVRRASWLVHLARALAVAEQAHDPATLEPIYPGGAP